MVRVENLLMHEGALENQQADPSDPVVSLVVGLGELAFHLVDGSVTLLFVCVDKEKLLQNTFDTLAVLLLQNRPESHVARFFKQQTVKQVHLPLSARWGLARNELKHLVLVYRSWSDFLTKNHRVSVACCLGNEQRKLRESVSVQHLDGLLQVTDSQKGESSLASLLLR